MFPTADAGNDASRFARPKEWSELLWVIGNIILSAGFIAMGASCTTIVTETVESKVVAADDRLRWLLCGSIAAAMYASSLIKLMVKVRAAPTCG